eukprot:Opistho-1_new@37001
MHLTVALPTSVDRTLSVSAIEVVANGSRSPLTLSPNPSSGISASPLGGPPNSSKSPSEGVALSPLRGMKSPAESPAPGRRGEGQAPGTTMATAATASSTASTMPLPNGMTAPSGVPPHASALASPAADRRISFECYQHGRGSTHMLFAHASGKSTSRDNLFASLDPSMLTRAAAAAVAEGGASCDHGDEEAPSKRLSHVNPSGTWATRIGRSAPVRLYDDRSNTPSGADSAAYETFPDHSLWPPTPPRHWRRGVRRHGPRDLRAYSSVMYGHATDRTRPASPGADKTDDELKRELRDRSPQVDAMLTSPVSSEWGFDMLALRDLTHNRPLFHSGVHLLDTHGLFTALRLDFGKLMRCLSALENGYRSNPYHNSTHAADVAQTMHWFMVKRFGRYLSPLEKCAALFASMAHDYGHPGVNNDFLYRTQDCLASLYNDTAILENYHTAATLKILAMPENDFLCNLSKDQRMQFRTLVVSMVLATNMAEHSAIMTVVNSTIDGKGMDFNLPAHRILLLRFLIKCCDISNSAKPPHIARPWSEMITEEFFQQGDAERDAGLKVSPFMDRRTPQPAKCQMSFIKFIVAPMFRDMAKICDVSEALDHLRQNLEIANELNKRDHIIRACRLLARIVPISKLSPDGTLRAWRLDYHARVIQQALYARYLRKIAERTTEDAADLSRLSIAEMCCGSSQSLDGLGCRACRGSEPLSFGATPASRSRPSSAKF